jgi:putative sigma-54 modulation protein
MTILPMKIDIKTTNLELTDAIRSYAEEKFGDLDKFIPNIKQPLEGRVELARTTFHHKSGDVFRAEININVPGELLRAESETGDIYASIDETKDLIQEEIKAYKERSITRDRKGGRLAKLINNYSPLSWLRGKSTEEQGE